MGIAITKHNHHNSLTPTFLSAIPNFLLEEVRLGLDKEIAPDGTYCVYFSFGVMIERSRMTSYHKKLFVVIRLIFKYRECSVELLGKDSTHNLV